MSKRRRFNMDHFGVSPSAKPVKIASANVEVVKEVFNALAKAFNDFSEERNQRGDSLEYVDGLMGCHNFYKGVILDLEERIRERGHPMPEMIRMIALETMAQALEIDCQLRRSSS